MFQIVKIVCKEIPKELRNLMILYEDGVARLLNKFSEQLLEY